MTFRIKTFFIILFTSFNFLQAQIPESLSLEECYKTAIEQSPLSSQISLIKQANNYSIKSLNSNYLPQFELNAQATYQSDVTKLPISLPKITIPSLSKDQYKASIDMKQIIFDGNTINRQKKLQYASNNTELQKVDIDIQKLKEQINNFYINILLLDENIKLIQILKEDINNNINKMSSMFENGITLSQNIDILQAELLKIEQKLIELRSNRKQLLTMLSILIKKPLSDSIILKTPMINLSKYDTISQRAELKLFDLQKNTLQNQSELLSTYNMPKIYLFATGGDGKPALNFLSDEFKWYYITGIKLSMPLSKWTSIKEEKQVIEIQKKIVDQEKENFIINNQMLIKQQILEIEKYKMLIEKDNEIIKKRNKIKTETEVKLINGVINSNDYLIEVNAENQALQNLKLHELQLLQAKINYLSLIGIN